MDLAEMLFDLYSHSKQRAQQADLTLNILLNIFDPGREGQIPVICVKTGLVGLCGAQLEEKYRFLFTAASCGKSSMTKKELSQLVYSWVQIPHYLQEGAAFGGVQTDATVDSAFEYRYTKNSYNFALKSFLIVKLQRWWLVSVKTIGRKIHLVGNRIIESSDIFLFYRNLNTLY